MNLALRVRTDRRSFVLKQSRPWVEKYDTIPAPWDRSLFECRFYELTRDLPGVANRMPKLLHADPEARVLVLEDLPEARDLTSLYHGAALSDAEIDALADFLRCLHTGTAGSPALPKLANREMRALNHEHLFLVPLADGRDLEALEPELADAAEELRRDSRYRQLVAETASRYLADGGCLVHGDYFPGSWLRTRDGLRVIDPEFAFPGDPEVDLGCALAHLALASQPIGSAERLRECYASSGEPQLDPIRLARYAAVEVMRRLIGVAKLPLPEAREGVPGFRPALLERSRGAMLRGDIDELWSH